jgi:hypothetical protein
LGGIGFLSAQDFLGLAHHAQGIDFLASAQDPQRHAAGVALAFDVGDIVEHERGALFFGQAPELKPNHRDQLRILVDQALDTAQLAVAVQDFQVLSDILVISQLTLFPDLT